MLINFLLLFQFDVNEEKSSVNDTQQSAILDGSSNWYEDNTAM